mgnify:CR=1 FL=1
MIVIYKAKFPNGKVYIGKSKNFESRKMSHFYNSTYENYNSTKMNRAINKYGFDNYVREVGKVLGLQPSISFLYIIVFIFQSLVTILSLFGLSELIKLLLSIEKKR